MVKSIVPNGTKTFSAQLPKMRVDFYVFSKIKGFARR